MKKCNSCNIEYNNNNLLFCTKCGEKLSEINEVEYNFTKILKGSEYKKFLVVSVRYFIGIILFWIGIIKFNRTYGILCLLSGVFLLPIIYQLLSFINYKKFKDIYVKCNVIIQIILPICFLVPCVIIYNLTNRAEQVIYTTNEKIEDVVVNEDDSTQSEQTTDINSKNIDENSILTFEEQLKEIINKIGMDSNRIKNITYIGEYNTGYYYKFNYGLYTYYVATLASGDIYSISMYFPPRNKKDYIYHNENIDIIDDDETTIDLQWDKLGEYGKYDVYNYEKYIRFYIPSGKYLVKALNKNSILFIEKRKIYKNSDGYDDSDQVKKITLANINDTDTITIKSDECITLVNGTYVSLKKVK